jgi:hypothetical protein
MSKIICTLFFFYIEKNFEIVYLYIFFYILDILSFTLSFKNISLFIDKINNIG